MCRGTADWLRGPPSRHLRPWAAADWPSAGTGKTVLLSQRGVPKRAPKAVDRRGCCCSEAQRRPNCLWCVMSGWSPPRRSARPRPGRRLTLRTPIGLPPNSSDWCRDQNTSGAPLRGERSGLSCADRRGVCAVAGPTTGSELLGERGTRYSQRPHTAEVARRMIRWRSPAPPWWRCILVKRRFEKRKRTKTHC